MAARKREIGLYPNTQSRLGDKWIMKLQSSIDFVTAMGNFNYIQNRSNQ